MTPLRQKPGEGCTETRQWRPEHLHLPACTTLSLDLQKLRLPGSDALRQQRPGKPQPASTYLSCSPPPCSATTGTTPSWHIPAPGGGMTRRNTRQTSRRGPRPALPSKTRPDEAFFERMRLYKFPYNGSRSDGTQQAGPYENLARGETKTLWLRWKRKWERLRATPMGSI
jgi:hypothetical protein